MANSSPSLPPSSGRFAFDVRSFKSDLATARGQIVFKRMFEVAMLIAQYVKIPGVLADMRCGLEKDDPQFEEKRRILKQFVNDPAEADQMVRQQLPERLIYHEFARFAKSHGMGYVECSSIRDMLSPCTWFVPTPSLLDMLEKLGRRFTDIGAKTGYLAAVLAKRLESSSAAPLCVKAVDNGSEVARTTFHPIIKADGVEYCKSVEARNTVLIFCWPRDGQMCEDCIKSWSGDTFVYIGERFGCTGDLYKRMRTFPMRATWEQDTKIVEGVETCTFPGIRDRIHVFRRRAVPLEEGQGLEEAAKDAEADAADEALEQLFSTLQGMEICAYHEARGTSLLLRPQKRG